MTITEDVVDRTGKEVMIPFRQMARPSLKSNQLPVIPQSPTLIMIRALLKLTHI